MTGESECAYVPAALTGVDMVTLLDPTEPDVATAIKSTREILERLGAKPNIERLDAAVAMEREGEPVRRATRRSEVATT